MNSIVQLNAPTHVELAITQRCNHLCQHCYNQYRNDGGRDNRITKEQANIILHQLELCGVGYVTLTGGEPFMEKDILFHFVELFRKRNIGVGLNTNLTLITPSSLKKLLELGFNNTILSSLPGFTAETCDAITQTAGSFQRIIKGIDICRNAGVPICLNVVITLENIKYGNELVRFINENMIRKVAITKVVPPSYKSNCFNYSFSKKDVQLMLRLMQRLREETSCEVLSLCSIPWCLADDEKQLHGLSTKCAAGITSCSIDSVSGIVTPCAHNDNSYGNIYKDSLKVIWRRMAKFRQIESLPQACQKCKILYKCGGECRLISKRLLSPKYELKTINHKLMPTSSRSHLKGILSDSQFYKMAPHLRFREESFGGTIIHGSHEMYIKHGLFRLLKNLNIRDKFTIVDLRPLFEMNESVDMIFKLLVEQGIIIPF